MLKIESLRRVSLFSDLGDSELFLIFRALQTCSFPAGSVIFSQGEPGEAVCFVESGQVKISTVAEDGREKAISLMGEGEVFGEVVLFAGGPYPATATAITDCAIGMLQNERLLQLVAANGTLAVSLLQLLSRRLRMAQGQLRDLALKDAFTRVGELLLHLAEQTGQTRSDGLFVPLGVTREELANLAGTTRETFTRVLGQLKRQDLVRVLKGGLLLTRPEQLRRACFEKGEAIWR
ncbi:MAG: Crp/Fnr family transcriptional regulator [Bacillota bacterium]|jgi:CRP/FNR family cyclic AMP-dependent transcriptional regulator